MYEKDYIEDEEELDKEEIDWEETRKQGKIVKKLNKKYEKLAPDDVRRIKIEEKKRIEEERIRTENERFKFKLEQTYARFLKCQKIFINVLIAIAVAISMIGSILGMEAFMEDLAEKSNKETIITIASSIVILINTITMIIYSIIVRKQSPELSYQKMIHYISMRYCIFILFIFADVLVFAFAIGGIILIATLIAFAFIIPFLIWIYKLASDRGTLPWLK